MGVRELGSPITRMELEIKLVIVVAEEEEEEIKSETFDIRLSFISVRFPHWEIRLGDLRTITVTSILTNSRCMGGVSNDTFIEIGFGVDT